MLHGDGEMFLIYFDNAEERFCYVIMQRDIADSDIFFGKLEKKKYFDWETPYGYGGPLTDSDISRECQIEFEQEIRMYCKQNNIVSQFIRFHPLLKNYELNQNFIEKKYMRDTIYIDTTQLELIQKNMDTKNRNMVRKAKKNNVEIILKPITELDEFIPMYEETMKNKKADDYYTFKKDYFEYIKEFNENAFVAYAKLEDRYISGAIFFFNEKFIHYHLSGSDWEYRKYSPNNLLLYEVACWANKKGIKKMHLGGGMSANDSLFGFKKQFNKNGRVKFYIGRTIFDSEKYKYLMEIRSKSDDKFDMNNNYMIQYRG